MGCGAPFSQSMSPWRATASPKVSKIPDLGHCANLCGHVKSDLLDLVCIAISNYVLGVLQITDSLLIVTILSLIVTNNYRGIFRNTGRGTNFPLLYT